MPLIRHTKKAFPSNFHGLDFEVYYHYECYKDTFQKSVISTPQKNVFFMVTELYPSCHTFYSGAYSWRFKKSISTFFHSTNFSFLFFTVFSACIGNNLSSTIRNLLNVFSFYLKSVDNTLPLFLFSLFSK